ncbi:MAG: LAGLIDADG endonuclease, partial [Parcubacteria group bacterium]
MRSKEIEDYKKNLEFTSKQRDIIVGLTLGDGHLETQNNGRTYKLKIEHSVFQKEYLDWLHKELHDWVRMTPKIRLKNNKPFSYHFSTYSHELLRYYGEKFYNKKKKVIPNSIEELLTPLSLAIWFMDDGSLKSKRHNAYVIHTLGYKRDELERIQKVLDKKFGLKTALHKQKEKYLRLYIPSDSAEK